MSGIPQHHTAAFWESIPRRLEEFAVKRVEDSGVDRVVLTSEGGWSWAPLKSDLGREIHIGEHLVQETVKLTQVTGLRDAHGWLFRRTNQELADEARQFSEDLHRKDVERLAECRDKYSQWESDLPGWLQARIRRFHEAGGEHFQLTGWGYELVICRLADCFDAGDEAAAEVLSDELGVSGNQWDCAKSLAAGRKRDGDGYAVALPAGISPITGSADYS